MNLDLFPQHHAPALHVSPRTDNTMTMVMFMADLVMVHSILRAYAPDFSGIWASTVNR